MAKARQMIKLIRQMIKLIDVKEKNKNVFLEKVKMFSIKNEKKKNCFVVIFLFE
jgi:hypothetical protein